VMHFQSTAANGHDWAFGSNFILGQGEFGIYDYTANASRLFLTATGNVGLGTNTPGQKLSVGGTIESTSGGFKFPDGSVQATAAQSGAVALAGTITLAANTSITSGTCISPAAVTVTGATTSMAVVISPIGNPAVNGLNELLWGAFVSAANQVTAQFCHFSHSTASATANQVFNIRVIP